jgi:hypothetical protein
MKISYVFNDRLEFSIGSGTALGRALCASVKVLE